VMSFAIHSGAISFGKSSAKRNSTNIEGIESDSEQSERRPKKTIKSDEKIFISLNHLGFELREVQTQYDQNGRNREIQKVCIVWSNWPKNLSYPSRTKHLLTLFFYRYNFRGLNPVLV
jgi:hypothetical protein